MCAKTYEPTSTCSPAAYGQYFVKYVISQGYTRLMRSLGPNIAHFLANLNNLHLHLTMGFPSMVAPAFRVEQVGAGGPAGGGEDEGGRGGRGRAGRGRSALLEAGTWGCRVATMASAFTCGADGHRVQALLLPAIRPTAMPDCRLEHCCCTPFPVSHSHSHSHSNRWLTTLPPHR